jgi:hypothetical protein
MINNQNKWSFFRLPSKPPLSRQDVQYWKNSLKKILKVGLEFEFNLPNKENGTCKGNSSTCPCMNLVLENKCWQQCINTENCDLNIRDMKHCQNVTGTCENNHCKTCDHFKMNCAGIFCPNFVSYCFICKDYKRNCEKCTYLYDPNKSPKNIRQQLNKELLPNNTYGLINKTGVHSITTDGSLLGEKGVEVITIGRRIDYWEFYKMARNINQQTASRGGYLNERCSIHMHLLASYYGKIVSNSEMSSIPARVSELEKDMPEVILANLHQLVRRYQNAMTWMMTGLDDPDHLTRWEKFRVSVLPVSAILNPMIEVKDQVANNAGGNKYGWINYNQVAFNEKGDIKRFHVEFRACDSFLSHSAIAAIACMYYALLIKAVEISRYGVVEIGDKEWLAKAQEVKASLLNNMKGYQDGDRFSDTSNLSHHYNLLIKESLELVRQLKHILIQIGPAYEVLEKLAEKPISLRRCEGQTWEQIEDDLKVLINEEGYIEEIIREIIDLRHISECKNISEWVENVNNIIRKGSDIKKDSDLNDIINKFVETKRNDGELVWSNPIGAPVFI